VQNVLNYRNNKKKAGELNMATKNTKAKNAFHWDLVKSWENTDGVNFAIALARLTGWLLHVDWWGANNTLNESEMIPLRVYVGTDRDIVYDITGKRRLEGFCQHIILPIAAKRVGKRLGGVVTRFYSEDKLFTLPLRVKPNEQEIIKAQLAIKENKNFLDKAIARLNPNIPADWAAQYAFGWCTIYAEALETIRNYPATAILVSKYTQQYQGSKKGFCHCVILHPDGDMEDSWGKQPAEYVLERYGIEEYTLSREEYLKVLENIKTHPYEKYNLGYTKAISFLETL